MSSDQKIALPIESNIQPGSLKTISDAKLISFAVGQQKKSRFQKLREEKEQKKKEEEKEAAKVYESFVASFAEESGPKSFVRGGSGESYDNNNQSYQKYPSNSRQETSRSASSITKPTSSLPTSSKRGNSELERIALEIQSKEQKPIEKKPIAFFTNDLEDNNDPDPGVSNFSMKGSNRMRQIDGLFNEIKSRQEKKDVNDNYHDIIPQEYDYNYNDGSIPNKGSFYDGDTSTTNIFISNLSPMITEEQLYDLFAKYGPINSIKVMWPRSEEERLRKRNCGFVSYMKRPHAEDALMFLQGYELGGYTMSLCWGKAVKVNPTPVSRQSVVSRSSNQGSNIVSDIPVAIPHTAKGFGPPAVRSSIESPVPLKSDKSDDRVSIHGNVPGSTDAPASGYYPGAPSCVITFPSDPKVKRAIDLLARYVAIDGEQFEKAIRAREEGNPIFRFLEYPDTAEGWYYRWKTFSLMMGDSGTSWRGEPFQITVGGIYLIPPPPPPQSYPGIDMNDNQSESSNDENERNLHRRERDEDSDDRESDSDSDEYMDDKTNKRRRSESHLDDKESSRKRRHSRSREKELSLQDKIKYAGMTGAQIERMKALERKGLGKEGVDAEYLTLVRGGDTLLSHKALRKWSDTLKSLTMSRTSIKNAMGFAYDHLDSCEEVVTMLRDIFLDPSTPPPRRIALLFLVSDLLHNSSAAVKSASSYRTLIQYYLPELFACLGTMFRGILGRITAQQIEYRVRNVLGAWTDWSIFPPMYIIGLESSFFTTETDMNRIQKQIDELRQSQATDSIRDQIDAVKKRAKSYGVFVTKDSSAEELNVKLQHVENYAKIKLGITSVSIASHDTNISSIRDQTKLIDDDTSIKEEEYQRIDGEEDIDGVPIEGADMDDIDGVPVDDDIDGVPMDTYNDDDIDGVPIDEDIDGQPMEDIDGNPLDEAESKIDE